MNEPTMDNLAQLSQLRPRIANLLGVSARQLRVNSRDESLKVAVV